MVNHRHVQVPHPHTDPSVLGGREWRPHLCLSSGVPGSAAWHALSAPRLSLGWVCPCLHLYVCCCCHEERPVPARWHMACPRYRHSQTPNTRPRRHCCHERTAPASARCPCSRSAGRRFPHHVPGLRAAAAAAPVPPCNGWLSGCRPPAGRPCTADNVTYTPRGCSIEMLGAPRINLGEAVAYPGGAWCCMSVASCADGTRVTAVSSPPWPYIGRLAISVRMQRLSGSLYSTWVPRRYHRGIQGTYVIFRRGGVLQQAATSPTRYLGIIL